MRPRMSLALAVSCTPGNWTTMRSAPCCWITGSATPSSLIRLCSVVMFCLSANSPIFFWASGFSVATSLRSLPSPCSARSRSGWLSAMALRALSRVSASRNLMTRRSPSRLTPAWRRFLSRMHGAQVGRQSSRGAWSARPSCRPGAGNARRRAGRGRGTSAARAARSASCGEAESRLRATTYCGSAGSGLKVFSRMSLAFNWVSVSVRRVLTPLKSS